MYRIIAIIFNFATSFNMNYFNQFFMFNSIIENNNGKLTLSSEMEGDTFVNGQVKHILHFYSYYFIFITIKLYRR